MYQDGFEIAELALRINATDIGMQSISRGETISQFRNRLALLGAVKSPEIGLSRQEIARYRLGDALEGALAGNVKGFEAAVDKEILERSGAGNFSVIAADPRHVVRVPIEVIRDRVRRSLEQRALTVGTTTSGGYLVDTENKGFVELALPRSIFGPLGVQVLDGLVGNVNIPVAKSAGNKTDLPAETTQASEVDQQFGQIALTPRGEGAYTEVSRLLLRQTSLSAQSFLVDTILSAFRSRLEYLALRGSGITGQPTGLLNASGTGSASGNVINLDAILALQTATGDRLGPNGAYLASRATAKLLAERPRNPDSSFFIWEGNMRQGAMGGYPGLSTSNMPDGTLAFGNWDLALFASWGALAIEVNPFSNFPAGIVGMRVLHEFDFALLDPAAFAIATGVT